MSACCFVHENSEWWKTGPQNPTPPKDGNIEEPKEEEEIEVEEVGSLGHLFNELVDATTSHENTGTSRDSETEVNLSFSDLETLRQRRTQNAVRKVPFSHPEAYLDKH